MIIPEFKYKNWTLFLQMVIKEYYTLILVMLSFFWYSFLNSYFEKPTESICEPH